MSHWSFAVSTPVLVFGLALWAWAAWLCHQNWRRNVARRQAGRLELLRFVLITLIALTLFRPEYVQEIRRTEKPVVAVLCDRSASMQTRDVTLTGGVQSRAEWLQTRLAGGFWKPLEKAARVELEDFAGAATNVPADEQGTDLNRVLENTLTRHAQLKAVLLLTDGDWNLGKSPVVAATRLRDQGVPVFAVAVGSDAPIPDLTLLQVSAPSYGLFGEQIVIPFKIRSTLPREVKTTVLLQDPRGDEVRKEVVIPPMADMQDALVWSPRVAGELTLSVELPVEEDEGLTNNNTKSFTINVRTDKLRVLVVDSLPRWEYRYLRNALERDAGVEMSCLLYHPGLAVGSGRGYLTAFPGTKEAISRYDVIFLGDVGVGDGELTSSDAALIKGLVEQQSSGLVLLPGRRGRQSTLLEGPLADLMPVTFDAGRPSGIALQNETGMLLTSAGRGHWLTRFDSDAGRNEELWKMLPGFFWCAAVEKSRPGSEVLAVHTTFRNNWGRMPLLVTRSCGSGKVLFLGTDSAWRWRRGVEDKFHYRFWSQVVRWMAHQRHLSEKEGIRLSYSPETPQAGDTVFLQGTVLDASGYPVENGLVQGRVTSPAGRSERLEFTAVEGGWGVFQSTFVPAEGGRYTVHLAAEQQGRSLETSIQVLRPVRELVGQPANVAILREMAALTQGQCASYQNLDVTLREVLLLPEPRPMEKRFRLWCHPLWGGLLLTLLAVYWTGRKLAGMI